VVVVGGGFIGLEVASGLAALGLRPTVIELAEVLWGGTLGTKLAAWGAARLEAAGVALRLGATVEAVEDGGVLVRGERLPAAFTVAGIGVEPRVELATGAGLAVDDGILVDAGGWTGHAAAWAAGDVARIEGERRVEHWHAAREAGERVGRSLLGMQLDPAPPAWVFSEIGGLALDVIGMPPTWDEERWLDTGHTVLAYLDGERVVGVASIGGAVAAADARRWISTGARAAEVVASLA
jgi:NADPH-dependent 2,4-dienoyl-CoA reductase/sulfur reductase-like enzyme